MSDDAMKALDEIEAALDLIGNATEAAFEAGALFTYAEGEARPEWADSITSPFYFGPGILPKVRTALSLLPTLRAALTPPTQEPEYRPDEVFFNPHNSPIEPTLRAADDPPALGDETEADEAYKLGVVDGYQEAVQEIDLRTGGDGEYRWSSDPERSVPDPAEMIKRIVERFEARALTPPADDEIEAIRGRHERDLAMYDGSASPVPRQITECATLLRALDAERARRRVEVEDMLNEVGMLVVQQAYDAGFMDSGEGWNGEHPGDAPTTEYYAEQRMKSIADIWHKRTLTKETP